MSGYPLLMCFILGLRIASPTNTLVWSRMPESGTNGSVWGLPSNRHPYRDRQYSGLAALSVDDLAAMR